MDPTLRIGILTAAVVAIAIAVGSLAQPLALAAPPDECLSNPFPPDPSICRACPTFVDPVVCTVLCKGGPQQRSFSNQCFATCSGLKFRGPCQRTGG